MTLSSGFSILVLSSALVISCGHRPLDGTHDAGREGPPEADADGRPDSSETAAAVPPFSIPAAPLTGSLRPCGTLVDPKPLGFLPDGRPLVAQYTAVADGTMGSQSAIVMVRAWQPRTAALEDLFVGTGLVVASENGRRIFELDQAGRFRVFDAIERRFLSTGKIPVRIRGISGDGNFVVDGELKRYTATGTASFDFRSLLSQDQWVPFPSLIALSTSGDVLVAAVASRTDPGVIRLLVVRDDGTSFVLSDSPGFTTDPPRIDSRCELRPLMCAVRVSRDGQFIMARAPESLRVWRLTTRELVYEDSSSYLWAAFSPDSQGLLLVDRNNERLLERSLATGEDHPWGSIRGWNTIEHDLEPPLVTFDEVGGRALFSGSRIGDDRGGLIVGDRTTTEGRWDDSSLGEYYSFAVTREAVFGTVDGTFVGSESLGQGIARWPQRGGPATHRFITTEAQSEFNGQILPTPDEQRIAVVLPDSVRVFDATNLAQLATIPSGAGSIAWSPDTQTLALTPDLHYRDPDRRPLVLRAEITLWSARDGGLQTTISLPVVPIQAAFDDSGKKIMGWGYRDVSLKTEDGLVHITTAGDRTSFEVDVGTGQVAPSQLPPFVTSTRELIATDTQILRISSGQLVAAFPSPAVRAAVFSSDWSVVVAQDEVPGVRVMATKDGHVIATAPAPMDSHRRLAVSHDGGRVAVADWHGVFTYCLDR